LPFTYLVLKFVNVATVLICIHFQIGHIAFVVAHFLCSGWNNSASERSFSPSTNIWTNFVNSSSCYFKVKIPYFMLTLLDVHIENIRSVERLISTLLKIDNKFIAVLNLLYKILQLAIRILPVRYQHPLPSSLLFA